MSNDTLDAVLDGIATITTRDELDLVTEALREQRASIDRRDAVKKRAGLNVGDTVRFSDLIRPKYLVGMTATVTKVNRQSVVVSCPQDPAYGRFAGSRNVRCPLTLIEGAA